MNLDRSSMRIVRPLLAASVVCVACSFGLAAAGAGQRIELNARMSIPLTEDVNGAAVGDFDEDGIPDIATVRGGYLPYGVDLYRGLGSRRFEIITSITTTSRPLAVVAADLNHDGHLDLATTGYASAAVTILLGDGAGGFGAPAYYGSTPQSNDLVVADFNGDTHPDVALTHASANTVDVFRGTGTGAFGPAMPVTIPAASSFGIVADDFNGDGKVDLTTKAPSGIVFIPGNGPLGFGTPVSSAAGSEASDLTSSDFDADGIPDLATTDRPSSSALILHGTGDGRFTLAQTLFVGQFAFGLTSGDLNADGRADLVVGSWAQPLEVFLGTGSGQFGAGVPYQPGGNTTLIIFDLDQDGRQDLLTAGGDLSLWRGDGFGRLAAETSLSFQETVPDIGAGDFDGDGMPDLVVLQPEHSLPVECPDPRLYSIYCGAPNQVLVLPGTGQGSFGSAISSPARCGPTALAIADFNGDGRPDIATANASHSSCSLPSLSILAGDGHGHFGTFVDLRLTDSPNDIVGHSPGDIVAGDFNEDGTPDLAVTFYPGSVTVYRLAPGPALVPAGTWVAPALPRSLAADDLNGDGHLDLAVALDNGDVEILVGNGAGQILPATDCGPGENGGTGDLAIGDFDGDFRRDIVAIGTNSARVLQVVGAGPICVQSSEVSIPAGSQGLGMRDLNLDGVLDLLVTDGYGRVSTVAGGYPGAFMADDAYGAYNAKAVTAADFDSDGLPDVAVANSNRSVSVVRNITPAAPRLTLRLEGIPGSDGSGGGGLPPGEGGSTLSWTGVLGATAYDVVRGSLSSLRTGGGNFSTAVEACLANDLPSTSVIQPGIPAPGDGWWFLARPLFPAGPGSYDGAPGQVGSRDAEIAASPLACP